MIKKRRKPVRVLVGGMCAAMIAAAGAAAAELKHDLYFCVNLSGQGQVMGSTTVHTASGLYRSGDRQNFEHVGFSHMVEHALIGGPEQPLQTLAETSRHRS
jgi:hypothetical protein